MLPSQRRLIRILAWLCLLGGLALFIGSILPYAWLKAAGDRLARDGNLQSFTYNRYLVEAAIARWVGIFLLGGGIIAWRKDVWVLRAASWLAHSFAAAWKRMIQDWRALLQAMQQISLSRWEWLALIVFTLVGLGLRAVWLNHPVEYDEGYTYSEFARYPLFQFFGDMSVANNHIFHSILVHYSTLIFGDSLPAIRLPVFVAGMLLILGSYLLGRAFYNRMVGLAAAGLAAVFPCLVIKSTSARGYMLIAAFTLGLFLLGVYVRRRKSFGGWVWIVLLGSAGFFTNMSMVYPAAAFFLWLFLNTFDQQTRRIYASAWGWLRWVFFSGLAMAGLSLALYLPVILTKGLWAFFTAAGAARPLDWANFINGLPSIGDRLMLDWKAGVSDGLLIALAAGVVFSIFNPFRIQREKISILAAAGLSTVALFFIQRPPFLARTWLWLLPLLLLQSAAGWLGLARWLGGLIRLEKLLPLSAAACLLAVTGWAGGMYTSQTSQSWNQPVAQDSRYVEDNTPAFVTLFLKSRLTTNDVVVVSNCTDAQYWYDFIFYQIPEVIIRRPKNRPFEHAYVIVYPVATCHNETLDSVVGKVGPDRVFLKLDQPRLIAQIGNAWVYDVDANPDVIRKVYNTP